MRANITEMSESTQTRCIKTMSINTIAVIHGKDCSATFTCREIGDRTEFTLTSNTGCLAPGPNPSKSGATWRTTSTSVLNHAVPHRTIYNVLSDAAGCGRLTVTAVGSETITLTAIISGGNSVAEGSEQFIITMA
jgi:hypothetical protein